MIAFFRRSCIAQFFIGQTLIENDVRGLVVVVEDAGWLLQSCGGLFKVLGGSGRVILCLVGLADIIVGDVVLDIWKFSLSQIVRIYLRGLKKIDGFIIAAAFKKAQRFLRQRIAVLGADFSFSAFPWMEQVAIQAFQRLVILSGAVKKRDVFYVQRIPSSHKIQMGGKQFQAFFCGDA